MKMHVLWSRKDEPDTDPDPVRPDLREVIIRTELGIGESVRAEDVEVHIVDITGRGTRPSWT